MVYSFSPQDYNNPQIDQFDVVTKRNSFSLRLNNSLEGGGRILVSWFLEGSYNLLGSYRFPTDRTLVEKELLPVRSVATLSPFEGVRLFQDSTYDLNIGVLARSVSGGEISLKNLKLKGSYVTSKDSKKERLVDQYILGAELQLWRLIGGGSITMDNIARQELYRTMFLGVKGSCWNLKVDYRRTYYEDKKDYIQEIFVSFNIFNLRDFKLPLRRR